MGICVENIADAGVAWTARVNGCQEKRSGESEEVDNIFQVCKLSKHCKA